MTDEIKAKLAALAARPKIEPIDNTELIRRFKAEGGGILHIRPVMYQHNGRPSRGCTVAYKMKSGRVEVATALTHRSDSFSKKIGTKTAIQHFDEGKTVTMPLNSSTPVRTLQVAFQVLS